MPSAPPVPVGSTRRTITIRTASGCVAWGTEELLRRHARVYAAVDVAAAELLAARERARQIALRARRHELEGAHREPAGDVGEAVAVDVGDRGARRRRSGEAQARGDHLRDVEVGGAQRGDRDVAGTR